MFWVSNPMYHNRYYRSLLESDEVKNIWEDQNDFLSKILKKDKTVTVWKHRNVWATDCLIKKSTQCGFTKTMLGEPYDFDTSEEYMDWLKSKYDKPC